MFTYRGRGGPSRSTPSSVQCQKCLKRGHYSYECKATAQERPYVSRPSRSQQFRNPKLVPKLTNETLNPLEQKKGVADEELAKLEAERAREREREQRDDGLIEPNVKRHGSVSSHSVSTISTGASQSPSPGEMIAAVAVAATVLARIVAEALVWKLDTGVPILVAAHLLKILTVATSTGPGTLYLLSKGARQRGIPGNIHRSLGVHIAFVVDVLGAQGRPSREANMMRGQIDPGLGMTVRDCHLVEGLMTEDMGTEVRVLEIKHENEALVLSVND
ncbi:hypothetical protein H9Q69_008405 [Fusarium xylarioides]|uniref:CCHC-type domain-containing protein n=1 Tax=Fusarium xylarioides TaxID=221167 RepID=A0A9P7IUT5_9HYPO|nr:hypothetical protein H9Q70_004279 [Fusarium xylarioides]KAG5765731.1 hypothetical protein H9Q72_006184 [Fusarium xylarioides]KAG5778480.1 hypothetical protein H9Q73_007866 [Fusarium xylarioides]KAG5792552.1 hypothetical protein H9Q69_008405 [Fusarium xylarioides]KAG5809731.1 hypothetical protein H9Q71_005959 [Fusarium xylarioides]